VRRDEARRQPDVVCNNDNVRETRMDDFHSPVDNDTYNLLQILTSKLEAIEAYNIYEEDMQGEARDLIRYIAEQDREHAERLIDALGLKRA
jgi:hypothetical protein